MSFLPRNFGSVLNVELGTLSFELCCYNSHQMNLVEKLERRSRPFFMGACLGFLSLVGFIDFLTGFEVFFSVFYLLTVGVGTWFVGRGFGFFLLVLSAAAWIAGDLGAGAHYSSSFIPIWN